MRLIFNRNLIALLILSGLASLASVQPVAAQQSTTTPGTGWKWIQDSPVIFCSGSNRSGCTPGLGNIVPTVAGSVWILQIQSPNNVTITSVTGGGGTWVHCTSCHVTNPSGFNADAWYNLTGNTGFNGANPFGFTLSGSAGSFLSVNFVELLPPPGTTASFDAAATATPTGCTSCTGPTLTLTGTDAVWMNPGGSNATGYTACGPSYVTDANGGCAGLNLPPGSTTPTLKFTNSSNPEFMALAFKSSAGTFSVPTPQYSIVNFTPTQSTGCGTCTVTIPATGSGHLLFINSANEAGAHITSVSGAGPWSVPNGCALSQTIGSQNNSSSCAYNLSSTSGATSLTITMSGNVANSFAIWEVSTTSGSFSLDAVGGTLNNGSGQGFYFPGQALNITGQNDVAFQLGWDVGGSLGPNYYPTPNISNTGSVGPFNYFLLNEAASLVLLDTGPTVPTPTWINAVPNQNTFVTGAAFTTAGGSTPPNPPSGLTAIVN